MQTLTRRSFLMASATGAMTLAAAGALGACSPKATEDGASGKVGKDANGKATDVLIIGGGIAGILSAISAKVEGVENVTIIEKLSMLGGSAWGSGGGIAIGSDYAPDSIDNGLDQIIEAYRQQQSYSARESEYPNWDKVRHIFGETGNTHEFLVEQGQGDFMTEIIDNGNVTGYQYAPDANAFMTNLIDLVNSLGVEVMTECPAESFIIDGDKVAGAVANIDGESTPINAKVVILATGGFASNPEMLAEYVPEAAEYGLVNRGTVGATGECIEMAYEVGAAGFSDYWCTISAGSMTFADDIVEECKGIADLKLTRATKQNVIVNSLGKRFVCEDVPDQSIIANYMVFEGTGPYYIVYSNPEADLQAVFDQGVESGAVIKADTVEKLEALLDIDDGSLVSTMDSYNAYCANGVDEEFGKPAENLVAMESGPYYALEFYTKMMGTMGGVKTDNQMQVLREDGSILEGLLAAGEVANRDLYNQMYVGGVCIGSYTTMGRLAGVTAAQLLSA